MNIKNIGFKLLPRVLRDLKISKKSYSQCGEDLILGALFKSLGVDPCYLDIGANHPFSLSNTYRMYRNGFCGTLVEPDPKLISALKKYRKNDCIIGAGVSSSDRVEEAKLYIMSASVLNTFSAELAKEIEAAGTYKVVDVSTVPLIPINQIFDQVKNRKPNYVSIDIEGMDYEVLSSIDFSVNRPSVFCSETLTFDPKHGGEKIQSIINLMEQNDYFVFADTRINTIFVDNYLWRARFGR